jgi:protein-disulfide isomerase
MPGLPSLPIPHALVGQGARPPLGQRSRFPLGQGSRAPIGQQTPPRAQDAQVRDLASLGYNEGDEESAVVRVIEFSDFGCVHCAGFHLEDYGRLHEEFIETGQVVWKYVPVALGGFPNGDYAAVAGECAGEQDRFAPMRDRIFEARFEWMQTDDPVLFFEGLAAEAGLEREAFATCLRTGEEARRRVAESTGLAREIGVQVTPTFIVHGQPVSGRPPYEAFRDALRQLVAQATPSTGG